MPGDKARKRNYEKDSLPKQGGTQGPGMSLEQHRTEFNQRAQWLSGNPRNLAEVHQTESGTFEILAPAMF